MPAAMASPSRTTARVEISTGTSFATRSRARHRTSAPAEERVQEDGSCVHAELSFHPDLIHSANRLGLTGGEPADTVPGKLGGDMKAVLLLDDGTLFEGRALGAEGEAFGEVVFNTSMTGYQEILTDPSYKGQIVTMSYPLIGNYGMTPEDDESRGAWLEGFVVREASCVRSSWRSTEDLHGWLARNGVVGIQGVDTRALTRHLRINGSRHGVISTRERDVAGLADRLSRAPRLVGRDLVKAVTCGGSL